MTIKETNHICAVSMDVSKKENGAYVKVGEVEYYVPTLEAFGIAAQRSADKEGKPLEEDGLPVYSTDEQAWLQAAIHSAVKANIRNKLVSGTAELKPGHSIPATLAELTAPSEGAASGAYLKQLVELKKLFSAWVASLGKSAGATQLLIGLFSNKASLATQTTANKEKMAAYIADFAEQLDAEALAGGQRYLQSLLDVCSAEIEADDF